ncbi:MAG: hypothetical protein HKO93_07735 [Flavobacteriales bacterium]|nr:hypothetical protein [Flavobacteriales bacterium]
MRSSIFVRIFSVAFLKINGKTYRLINLATTMNTKNINKRRTTPAISRIYIESSNLKILADKQGYALFKGELALSAA